MNNKGLQLLEDLKNIPDFDSSGMESDLDDVNLKWETANSVRDMSETCNFSNVRITPLLAQLMESDLDELNLK